MKTTIYTAYHKRAPLIKSKSISPIHVGRVNSNQPLVGMGGDDEGITISERNSAWCELTALYWAWKNDSDSDYIGLMHYRRVLDLTGRMPGGPAEQSPALFHIGEWCDDVESWLDSELDHWDIIVPRTHLMGQSVETNYCSNYPSQDWELLRQIIYDHYPTYAKTFDAVSDNNRLRLGNIAIMARPIFERYCAWLFDILFRVESSPHDRKNYNISQVRFLGFLAERLLTIFISEEESENSELRIKETSILNLTNSLVTPYIGQEEAPSPQTVNIAFSADRNYLPHSAAMLRSLLDHADLNRPINIFFLYSSISNDAIQLLRCMISEYPSVILHAINTHGLFDNSYRSTSRAPSNATYNRFLLFSLLPGLDRVLYLDADVILTQDVCKLYDTEMGDAYLGAVPDWIMSRTLTGPTKTIDPNVPDLRKYHYETLGLSDAQISRYFNAGVLLFNFAAIHNLESIGKEMVRKSEEKKYLFRDQDILNVQFAENLFLLDPRWNVFNSLEGAYDRVPQSGWSRAMAARRDPWLVHFADKDYKPWLAKSVPYADLYWQALVRTPFFGEVVCKLRQTGPARLAWRDRGVRAGRKLAERFPFLKVPLLRIYSRLRRS